MPITIDQIRRVTDLVARLEGAPCGSDELDAEICDTLGWKTITVSDKVHWFRPATDTYVDAPPPFTQRLDWSLALLPKGKWWFIGTGAVSEDEPMCGAAIVEPKISDEPIVIAHGEHPSSAEISFCVAALMASFPEAFADRGVTSGAVECRP